MIRSKSTLSEKINDSGNESNISHNQQSKISKFSTIKKSNNFSNNPNSKRIKKIQDELRITERADISDIRTPAFEKYYEEYAQRYSI